MMKLGSLFDGIGGALLCAVRNGIEPVWASEIEKFPIKVTEHHFPQVKHLGDITKINGAEIEPVDIIVGGSPCQDLSVAGKRAGLAGERSGLFMDQIRIIREMRNATDGARPRYMVWENVPGAMSSNGGEDFRAVLEETARVADRTVSIPGSPGGWSNSGSILADGFSISWRILDAQYWGVPQRRRRIYLVADFGGQSAPKILFERESVSGNPAESRSEGQGAAEDAERGVGGAGFDRYNGEVTGYIFQTLAGTSRLNNVPHLVERGAAGDAESRAGTAVCIQGSMIGRADKNGPQGDGINEDVSFTLNTTDRHAVVYGICSFDSNSMKSDNPHSGIYEADTARTIDQNGGNPACNQGGMAVCYDIGEARLRTPSEYAELSPTITSRCGTGGNNVPAVIEPLCIEMTSTKNTIIEDGISPTLTARMGTGGNQVNAVCRMVAFGEYTADGTASAMKQRDYKDATDLVVAGCDFRNDKENGDLCGTLQAKPNGGFSINCIHPVRVNNTVRRLTPLECCRLQGYPDGWTDIPGASDSARYKALGNSFAIPCADYVIRRCKEEFDERPQH